MEAFVAPRGTCGRNGSSAFNEEQARFRPSARTGFGPSLLGRMFRRTTGRGTLRAVVASGVTFSSESSKKGNWAVGVAAVSVRLRGRRWAELRSNPVGAKRNDSLVVDISGEFPMLTLLRRGALPLLGLDMRKSLLPPAGASVCCDEAAKNGEVRLRIVQLALVGETFVLLEVVSFMVDVGRGRGVGGEGFGVRCCRTK